jgi:hypothetical protein
MLNTPKLRQEFKQFRKQNYINIDGSNKPYNIIIEALIIASLAIIFAVITSI